MIVVCVSVCLCVCVSVCLCAFCVYVCVCVLSRILGHPSMAICECGAWQEIIRKRKQKREWKLENEKKSTVYQVVRREIQ